MQGTERGRTTARPARVAAIKASLCETHTRLLLVLIVCLREFGSLCLQLHLWQTISSLTQPVLVCRTFQASLLLPFPPSVEKKRQEWLVE